VIGFCLRGQLEFPFSIQETKKRKEKKQITKPKIRIKKNEKQKTLIYEN